MDERCARNRFAELLGGWRTEAGLSQEALSALAGVSVRALRDMETGRVAVPQQRSAEALAGALDLSGEAREHFLDTVSSARRDRNRNRTGRTRRMALAPAAPPPMPGGRCDGMELVLRPAQMPPAPPSFIGRAAELTRLRALLEAGTPAAVTGPAGIGKTALALHVAHRVRDRFPDGQLYVDLRIRPDGDVQGAPGEGAGRGDQSWLLVRLLRDLGVPGDRIPVGAGQRAEALRGIADRRRLLIVLDDVPGPEAVQPLLPCAPRISLVLTSRRPRTDLAEWREVPLEPLRFAESAELFGRIVGRRRTAPEPEATTALLELCAGSPRALRGGALWLTRRPGWSVAAAVRRLSQQQRDLTG